MASSNPTPAPLSPAFAAAFARASGPARTLRFDAFMALALYDPQLGYYRRDQLRVGRHRTADFYTATSIGPLFGELVAAASAHLLAAAGLDPAAHTFVEIGAEPTGGVLSGVATHPFAASRTVRVGQTITLNGPCVIFSNELFDAQPLRRFRRDASGWREIGVRLCDDGIGLSETDLGPAPSDVLDRLPPPELTPEGYQFDAPLAAATLAAAIAAQPWHGLFVAFDYGKTFAELGHSHPAGTARAYFQHTQSNALLDRPGEQDLTAHVCWDWLANALAAHGCAAPTVVSQESFIVHHADDFISEALTRESSRPGISPRKQALMHLLHPGQMGQKFQVLHALKPISHIT
ncbi:MAG: SAM-dependent methyltransferase [Verrucomicrobia bacterium]|nr:SAM-dependent methyltransferase [Verrucomicrobiota bacterium]